MVKTNAKRKRKRSRWQQAYIYIPSHSSELIIFDRKFKCDDIYDHFDFQEKHEHESERKKEDNSQCLILQIHGDGGIMWRGILPILRSPCSSILRNFVICVTNHFSSSICESLDDLQQMGLSNTILSIFSHSQRNKCDKEDHTAPLIETFQVTTKNNTMSQTSNMESIQGNTVLHIILLAPHPFMHFQSFSTCQNKYTYMFPERLFTPRLIRMQNNFIQLQTLNAYLSTMGGGYFMCRHLNRSIEIARQQCKVALSLGDIPLALKCRLNEAYNYIYGNQLEKAFQTIEWVYQFIKKKQKWKVRYFSHVDHPNDMEFIILLRMCQSAKLFGMRVQKEQKFVRDVAIVNSKTYDVKTKQHGYSNTHDDYQRIRISNKDYFTS